MVAGQCAIGDEFVAVPQVRILTSGSPEYTGFTAGTLHPEDEQGWSNSQREAFGKPYKGQTSSDRVDFAVTHDLNFVVGGCSVSLSVNFYLCRHV
ncbi:MAG: hypothetical protein ACRDRU_03420 [Pseudonocardiaceae bacterium]